jgi:hypothetical protein
VKPIKFPDDGSPGVAPAYSPSHPQHISAYAGENSMSSKNNRPPLLTATGAIATILAIIAALAWGFDYFMDKSTQMETPRMFALIFHKGIPSEVTELQGVGWGHSGYSIRFRFHASPAAIRELLNRRDWKPAEWEVVKSEFELQKSADARHFQPPWNPQTAEPKKVYYIVSPVPRHGGGDYMLIDDVRGIVYVAGSGI